MDKARARALLDQERRRLEQLGRAVARDHDDAVATSSPEDQVDGADRRVAEETSQALGERLGDRWDALERAEARLAAGTYGCLDPERSAHSRRAAGGVPAGRADRPGGSPKGPGPGREARTGVEDGSVSGSLPGVR